MAVARDWLNYTDGPALNRDVDDERLVDGAASLGIELSRRQVGPARPIGRALCARAIRVNLTRITDPGRD